MYVDKDKQNKYAICELTESEILLLSDLLSYLDYCEIPKESRNFTSKLNSDITRCVHDK